MNDIDKALDAMTEAELVAVEQELDKKAAEVAAEYHFAVGVKMARESVSHFQKTGKLTDAMALVFSKTAAEDDDKGTHPIARAITHPAVPATTLGLYGGLIGGALKGRLGAGLGAALGAGAGYGLGKGVKALYRRGQDPKNHPIASAIVNPKVHAAVGGAAILPAAVTLAKIVGGPKGVALAAGLTGGQAALSGGMQMLNKEIYRRAFKGEENVAKAAGDFPSKFQSMSETEKTAFIGALGGALGKGLIGLGLKGSGQGLGQGLARRVGMEMIKRPKLTGAAVVGAGGMGIGAMSGDKNK
jgi:hypothetical protein